MARRNTRASSAAGTENEEVQQLGQARAQNDLKLKSRFERIFRKYDHNFEGVGDEIDIRSGEIVVNNGHLQNMRDEADPGKSKSASSRFVRNFQENLEHEVASEDEDEESEDEDDDSVSEDDGNSQIMDNPSTIEPFRALPRPPPRLAQLLVGNAGAMDDNDDEGSVDVFTASDVTGPGTGLLTQVPALHDSMSALVGRPRRSAVDADTINALGTSIANQLAQLMAGPAKKKNKTSQQRSRREKIDPVWDYPEIGTINRQKRKRSPSPVIHPPISSPPIVSPGQRSLWAPRGFRLSKHPKHAATPSLRRTRSSIIPSSAVRSSDLMRCMNCSFTNSPTWQAGPGGGVLCASCGKYYDHHGRMKPFDSPTPSVEESDMSSELTPESDLTEPVTAGVLILEEDTTTEPSPSRDVLHEPPPIVMTSPADMQSPQRSCPAKEPTPEVTPMDLDGSRAFSEIVVQPRPSPPAQQNKVELVDPSDSLYLIDTPQTYPANTSRHMTSVTKTKFTAEEDALLFKLKEDYDLPWNVVALQFPQRTLFTVQNHYSRVTRQRSGLQDTQLKDGQDKNAAQVQSASLDRDADWNHAKDELLYELRHGTGRDWAHISTVLPGHSIEELQTRYAKLAEQAELNRDEQLWHSRHNRHWKPQEDALILRLREIDQLAWHQVAARFVDRSVQSIQKRYARDLAPEKRTRKPSDPTRGTAEEIVLEADPDLAAHLGREKPRPFEPAEDDMITRLVGAAKKPDWQAIAAQLPGRSVHSVFVRYTTRIKINNKRLKPQVVELSSVTAPRERSVWHPYEPSQPKSIRRTDDPPRIQGLEASSPADKENAPTSVRRPGPGARTSFTQSEDSKIMQLKASNNASWEEISFQLPGRSANAVSQRFSELLKTIPGRVYHDAASISLPRTESTLHHRTHVNMSNHRRFTREEDDLISHFHAQGMAWEDMTLYFSQRTPSSLREQWHSKIRPRPRHSMPTSTYPQTGMLRIALDNSRRRSDVQSHDRTAMIPPDFDNVIGDADHPITLDDELDMNAPSEQLVEELHSSVVRKSTSDSQIDPRLLELDRVSSRAQNFRRLVKAAGQYVSQRNNSLIVQRMEHIFQCNADDPRLNNLLELTSLDSSHTPAEIEWALEAFELGQAQIPDDRLADPMQNTTDGREKGKEKAREASAFTVAPLPLPQHGRDQTYLRGNTFDSLGNRRRQSIVRPPGPDHHASVQSDAGSVVPAVKAHKTSTDQEHNSRPRLANVPARGNASTAMPKPPTDFSNSGKLPKDPVAASHSPCNAVSSRSTVASPTRTSRGPSTDEGSIFKDLDLVRAPPTNKSLPRRKRTTDSAKDVQECLPVKAMLSPRTGRDVPTRGRLRNISEPMGVERNAMLPCAPDPDLTIEIPDSDDGDQLSSTPARTSLPRQDSSGSGKRVKFVGTVDVRGSTRNTAADASSSLDKQAQHEDENEARKSLGSVSSPTSSRGNAPLSTTSATKAKKTIPSSSPVFMKPSMDHRKTAVTPQVTATPTTLRIHPPVVPKSLLRDSNRNKEPKTSIPSATASTPVPKPKSRLTQLRRETTYTNAAPQTPKTDLPRRYSTPTAFYSHRASPAVERGPVQDRFGLGRKRIVDTPIRELAKKVDLEEDELA